MEAFSPVGWGQGSEVDMFLLLLFVLMAGVGSHAALSISLWALTLCVKSVRILFVVFMALSPTVWTTLATTLCGFATVVCALATALWMMLWAACTSQATGWAAPAVIGLLIIIGTCQSRGMSTPGEVYIILLG
jgi:hypothetical protein